MYHSLKLVGMFLSAFLVLEWVHLSNHLETIQQFPFPLFPPFSPFFFSPFPLFCFPFSFLLYIQSLTLNSFLWLLFGVFCLSLFVLVLFSFSFFPHLLLYSVIISSCNVSFLWVKTSGIGTGYICEYVVLNRCFNIPFVHKNLDSRVSNT